MRDNIRLDRRLLQSCVATTQKVLLPVIGLTFTLVMLFLGLINHYSYESLCGT